MQEREPQALHARLSKVHKSAQRSAHLVHQLLSLAAHRSGSDAGAGGRRSAGA